MRQSDVARFGGSQCALRQRAWVGGTQCCAIPRSSREASGWRTVGAEGDGATPNSDLVVELARRACSINSTTQSEGRREPSFHWCLATNDLVSAHAAPAHGVCSRYALARSRFSNSRQLK